MSEKQYFISRCILTRIAVLICWIVFFVYMIFSSKYARYLHPSLAWLLVSASVLMAGMIVSLIMNIKEEHQHDDKCRESNHLCAYRHRFKLSDFERVFIFLVPIFVVVFIPLSRGLSASMIGGIYSDDFDINVSKELKKKGREEIDGIPVYYISEVLGASEQIPDEVVAVGMVYKSRMVEKPHFYLIRFYVTCCAADARPVMLEISTEDIKGFKYENLNTNQWVSIKGSADKQDDKVVFRAHEIKPYEKPENEYMY